MNIPSRRINPIAASNNGESAALQKLQNAAEKSRRCFPSVYSVIIPIDANSANSATTRIDAKGDFLCEYITGKIWAVDGNGALVPTVKTGVKFNVNESGNNRDLFLSPVAAETILTPGYGDVLYEKWNLRDYVFKKTTTVQVSAQNSDATRKQFLELSFIGFQFIGGVN